MSPTHPRDDMPDGHTSDVTPAFAEGEPLPLSTPGAERDGSSSPDPIESDPPEESANPSEDDEVVEGVPEGRKVQWSTRKRLIAAAASGAVAVAVVGIIGYQVNISSWEQALGEARAELAETQGQLADAQAVNASADDRIEAAERERDDARADAAQAKSQAATEIADAEAAMVQREDAVVEREEAVKLREDAVSATEQHIEENSFGAGTYRIGEEIRPGTYRSSESRGCYWERLSGFSGSLGDIIANDFTNSVAVVTIQASDVGFSSSDCGTWTIIE